MAELKAKPFLKWAGGKGQLLDELSERLPNEVRKNNKIERYVEPFVGGGAVFFYLKRNFDVEEAFLFDINRETVVGYKTIKYNPKKLIVKLAKLEKRYLKKNEDKRSEFYYQIRDDYNKQMHDFDYENYNEEWIKRAAYLIFLNKTCFNGLFRQNKKGEFNVPHGRYKNPTICDGENLKEVNKALKGTKIFCADFTESKEYITNNTLVYFDPPYRPLDDTSNFTGYFKAGFDDSDQKRLANFFKSMNKKDAKLILSNSDPKNSDPEDDFFDDLYKGYVIDRVKAKRSINSNGEDRGEINELIIKNFGSRQEYINLLKVNSFKEVIELFFEGLVETNKPHDFFVDWEKVKKQIKSYKIELNILTSLIGSADFDNELRTMLQKYPEIIPVIPMLIAINGKQLKVLNNSLKSDSSIMDYNFNERVLSEEEIEKLINFFNKTGLKTFLKNSPCTSLVDYLTGIRVGMDIHARGYRGRNAFNSALKPLLNRIIEQINLNSNITAELFCKKKFSDLEEKLDISFSNEIRNKKADFIVVHDDKIINLEVDFYKKGYSKQEKDIDYYVNYKKELSKHGIQFIWISDGEGWTKAKEEVKKAFENLGYLLNLDFIKKGILRRILYEML